jgi:hypothetical protein
MLMLNADKECIMRSLEGLVEILIACGSDEVMTGHTHNPGLLDLAGSDIVVDKDGFIHF